MLSVDQKHSHGGALAETTSEQNRILILITEKWELGGRISLELGRIGFSVASIMPRRHMLRNARTATKQYVFASSNRIASLVNSIIAWSPEFLVCVDDQALTILLELYARIRFSNRSSDKNVAKLIEFSLGDPDALKITAKSSFIDFATSMGLRCPQTVRVQDELELTAALHQCTYPVVLKRDGTSGGIGVRIVRSEVEARQAFRQLQIPAHWPSPLRKIASLLPSMKERTACLRPEITLQVHVPGQPANRALACWQGSVLAGVSVQVLQVSHETGPATVVQIIDHPELDAVTKMLVGRLKVSGFCGFDFILDPDGTPWLLEMNPRVTPTCHIRRNEEDLLRAIYLRLTGAEPRITVPRILNDVIALFPHEWLRDPTSGFLNGACYHDVPWDSPEFVSACQSMRPSIMSQYVSFFLGAALKTRNANAAPIIQNITTRDI